MERDLVKIKNIKSEANMPPIRLIARAIITRLLHVSLMT